MTAGMKILQIERVVRHLIDGAGIKVLGARFKFDDEDDALADDNRTRLPMRGIANSSAIHPSPNSRSSFWRSVICSTHALR